jgi:hypothetical protein
MSTNVEAYPEADRSVSTTLRGPGEESLVMQGASSEVRWELPDKEVTKWSPAPLVGSGTCVRMRLCILQPRDSCMEHDTWRR